MVGLEELPFITVSRLKIPSSELSPRLIRALLSPPSPSCWDWAGGEGEGGGTAGSQPLMPGGEMDDPHISRWRGRQKQTPGTVTSQQNGFPDFQKDPELAILWPLKSRLGRRTGRELGIYFPMSSSCLPQIFSGPT